MLNIMLLNVRNRKEDLKLSKLKTIKIIKYFRLDELIHYIKENNIINKSFHTVGIGGNECVELTVHDSELFEVYGHISRDSVFPVEVEEKITTDMFFSDIIEVYEPSRNTENNSIDNYYTVRHANKTIDDIKKKGTKRVYALINGEIRLIWEDL